MPTDPRSLAHAFAALEAERERTWPPEQLGVNQAQRAALVADFDPSSTVQIGDRLDNAQLIDSEGQTFSLNELVARGPAVLIFFRFESCPADNIALPYYDRALWPVSSADTVPIIAISPQLPDRLHRIVERHDLRLKVASDPDNRLARSIGLTFTPAETPPDPPSGWIGEVTGTGTWELPLTSVLIIDQDRRVRFVAISPDWLDRIEAAHILTEIAHLAPEAVA